MRIILLTLFLYGCQDLGLAFNSNSVNHLRYEKEGCIIEVWQRAFSVSDDEATSYVTNENVSVSDDCTFNLEYSEQDGINEIAIDPINSNSN